MRKLIVNTINIQRWRTCAVYKLHNANVDSQMLVLNKSSDDYTVVGLIGKVEKAMEKLRVFNEFNHFIVFGWLMYYTKG